jgi:hypothetical protein
LCTLARLRTQPRRHGRCQTSSGGDESPPRLVITPSSLTQGSGVVESTGLRRNRTSARVPKARPRWSRAQRDGRRGWLPCPRIRRRDPRQAKRVSASLPRRSHRHRLPGRRSLARKISGTPRRLATPLQGDDRDTSLASRSSARSGSGYRTGLSILTPESARRPGGYPDRHRGEDRDTYLVSGPSARRGSGYLPGIRKVNRSRLALRAWLAWIGGNRGRMSTWWSM